MTETEWLACDLPSRGFANAIERFTSRQQRLSVIAACGLALRHVSSPVLSYALSAAERFADGRATEGELVEAAEEVNRVTFEDDGYAKPGNVAVVAHFRFGAQGGVATGGDHERRD